MIRAFHAGLGKVRLGLARIGASLSRIGHYLYLRPFYYTHNAERASKSPFWYYCCERRGTVLAHKGVQYAPRKVRRRARIGRFLSVHLGLAAADFRWREYKHVERDKYALNLKGIVFGLANPKPLKKVEHQTIPDHLVEARKKAANPPMNQISRLELVDGQYVTKPLVTYPSKKPEQTLDAIDVAWDALTPAEKRAAKRRDKIDSERLTAI